jgi:hypothetical protein
MKLESSISVFCVPRWGADLEAGPWAWAVLNTSRAEKGSERASGNACCLCCISIRGNFICLGLYFD